MRVGSDGGTVPDSIFDPPPREVVELLDDLTEACGRPVDAGGIPSKTDDAVLLATWNIREFGRYTARWASVAGDSPTRDLRSLLCIATILERFDVIAIQELQDYTDALGVVLSWLNRASPARWRIVVSDVVRGAKGDRERLGYLFDSFRYDLDGLVGELVIPPEEIGVPGEQLQHQFAKTPYAVSFRSMQDPTRAFVLVTMHVIWGDRPELRPAEATRIARWIGDWAETPSVWDPDIFALGDFNADRVVNPATGRVDPMYESFAEILTIPEKMHSFPRTIFASGKNKHYDMITWHEPRQGRFGLTFDDCGYFDIDTVLRPRYGLSTQSFSFRVSDHFPMWARFT